MAVDKATVIERLKALYPKVNLSQKRMDSIADRLSKQIEDEADEATIDEAINDFNEFMDLERIAKDDDRVRREKAKKGKKRTPKKPKNEDEDEEDEEEEDLPEDTPAWAKKLLEDNKALKKQVKEIEQGKVTETKKQQAQKAFESSTVLKSMKEELQEKWISRIDPDSEVSIEDQVKDLEEEYTELAQTSADTNRYGGPAGEGSKPIEVKQEAVDNVVDRMNI